MEPVLNETPLAESPVFVPPTEQSATVEPQRPFGRYILTLGIALILNIFFVVVISLVHPAPTYGQYCEQIAVTPTDSISCDAQGGVWVDYSPESTAAEAKLKMNGVCDMYAKCALQYQAANDVHLLIFLFILIVIGLIQITASYKGKISSPIVSTGVFYGGVLSIILGAFSYWGVAGNWTRLLFAVLGLGTLLYLGYRRHHD